MLQAMIGFQPLHFFEFLFCVFCFWVKNRRDSADLFFWIFSLQINKSGEHAEDARNLFHFVKRIFRHVALVVVRHSARYKRQDSLQIAVLAVQLQLVAQSLNEPGACAWITPRVKAYKMLALLQVSSLFP